MSIKEIVKQVIGPQRISSVKGKIMHYVCSVRLGRKGKLLFNGDRLSPAYEFSSPGYHVYRGYYDLQYLETGAGKFLAHRLPLNAASNKDTKIEIGCFDTDSGAFIKVADSSAWCWQQGSRLRWHPQNNREIIFNDANGKDGYCTRIVSIDSGKEIKRIDWPLYDISRDFSYGLSINFERLQRLRPGYGYNFYSDLSIGSNAPDNDGLLKVDIETNKAEMLFTLKDLARRAGAGEERECYLNHISIAPNGEHFLFFLIICEKESKGWDAVLFVSDRSGNSLKILEKEDRVSHYCWMDESHIMVTCHKKDNTEYYCTFSIEDGKKSILSISNLSMDGHPSVFRNGEFVTDTYPRDNSLQRIRFFKLSDKKADTALAVYHDYRLRGEKRCDLHPSVEDGGRYISVDSTYKEGKRSILVLKTKE